MSTRMGFPKLRLARDRQPVIAEMITLLRETGWSKVAVIISDKRHEDFLSAFIPETEVLFNPHPEQGMISSIRLIIGIFAQKSSGLLTWPIDHPVIKPETLKALRQEALNTNIAIPSYTGRNGHPVWWGRDLFPMLMSTLADKGARGVLKQAVGKITRISVDDPGILMNVNTPEEAEKLGLKKYIQRYEKRE